MLFRSTGLGKTELVAEVDKSEGLTRKGDYLILHIATIEPVKWKIRAALDYKDVITVLRQCLKISIIMFLFFPVRAFRPAKPPGDF